MWFWDLTVFFGLCMGYYVWRWEKNSENIGFHIYSVYYFYSNVATRHANAVDSPVFYDIYHDILNGRASYADYLRAVDKHYDDALITVKEESWQVLKYLARFNGFMILIFGIIATLFAWSFDAIFLFLLGVLIYLVARFIKFLIEDDNREFLYTDMIINEAIKKFHKSKPRKRNK